MTHHPTPDDGRLDRRRIDLAVLNYRAAERRRRWPLVLTVGNGVGAIAFALMAIQNARAGAIWAAALPAVAAGLMAWMAARFARTAAASNPPPADTPPVPVDFTGLGGPDVVERMARITDEPEE